MMTAEEAAAAAKGLTFEKVWAMFQETDRLMKERQAETERLMKERQAEAERLMKERQAEAERLMKERQAEAERLMKERQAETERLSKDIRERQAETDRLIKELSKNIGGVNNLLGKWTEEMVTEKLWEKFNHLGYSFTEGQSLTFWENGKKLAEVDVFLANGDYAMPVEVKTSLTRSDVDEHLERIEKVRGYMDKHGDKRKLVGSVAGAVVPNQVRSHAIQQGLYVLVQSGDSFALADIPDTFKPREWQAAPQ